MPSVHPARHAWHMQHVAHVTHMLLLLAAAARWVVTEETESQSYEIAFLKATQVRPTCSGRLAHAVQHAAAPAPLYCGRWAVCVCLDPRHHVLL